MQSRDDENDAYYLVSNRHGGGKTIVRRPPTALSSNPLDDNFDATTVSRPGTRYSRHWGPGESFDVITVSASQADDDVHGGQGERRSIPLDDNFDAMSISRVGGESRNGDRTFIGSRLLDDNSDADTVIKMDGRQGRWLTRRRSKPGDDIRASRKESPHRHRSSSRRRESCRQNDAAMVERVHTFGGNYGNEVGNATGSIFDQNLRMSRGRSPSGDGKPGSRVTRNMRAQSSLNTEVEAEGSRLFNHQERGRDPTSYQMVEQPISEDGPVRMVSKWREEVARSAGTEEKRPFVMEKAKKTSGYDADVDRDGDLTGVDYAHWRRRLPDSRPWGGREKGKESGKEKARSPLRNTYTNPIPSSRHDRATSAENFHSNSSSSPSTKVHRSTEIHPQPRHPNREAQSWLQISHSSNSSSFKAKSSPTLEFILSTCEPSLLHIAPILKGLGIRREEHLRALVKLSEETRDKEVREEAFRKGVTVVEWAILLDRMHSL